VHLRGLLLRRGVREGKGEEGERKGRKEERGGEGKEGTKGKPQIFIWIDAIPPVLEVSPLDLTCPLDHWALAFQMEISGDAIVCPYSYAWGHPLSPPVLGWSQEMTSCEYVDEPYGQRLCIVLRSSEDDIILRSLVLAQYRRVTDRQKCYR